MLKVRSDDRVVPSADVGFAAVPDPLAASPPDLILVAFVLRELVAVHVDHQVPSAGVAELN